MVDPERPKSEVAGLTVQQTAEHTGRIEPRNTQPTDRPIRRHQRARMAVGQKRIIRNRRKRRRRGRTPLLLLPLRCCAHDGSLGHWLATCADIALAAASISRSSLFDWPNGTAVRLPIVTVIVGSPNVRLAPLRVTSEGFPPDPALSAVNHQLRIASSPLEGDLPRFRPDDDARHQAPSAVCCRPD